VKEMDKANFPIEFNNEIDEVKKSENEFYTLAVDRLSELAEGHNDISGGVVNFKQPAQGHQTSYIYETTIADIASRLDAEDRSALAIRDILQRQAKWTEPDDSVGPWL
jgi:hypothetical protein